MFTGIVTSIGTVLEAAPDGIVVRAPGIDEPLGASIAVDGCCLTVVASEPDGEHPASLEPGAQPVAATRVRFDVLPETRAHTVVGEYEPGRRVDLEPALRAGQPLGGHWVQGHVDGVARVTAASDDPDGRWRDLELELPPEVLELTVPRGSITVAGTSLTVMDLDDAAGTIRLQLVPETLRRTVLGELRPGARANVEADVLARYVQRLLRPTRPAG